MNSDNSKMGRVSVGFAMAASVTVIFSTALAWVKDAYKPLNSLMNAIAWHNWITHGLIDVILFFGLGLIFSKTNRAGRIASNRLISFLVTAVAAAGIGLFAWYLVY
jgi:hypothetical protein